MYLLNKRQKTSLTVLGGSVILLASIFVLDLKTGKIQLGTVQAPGDKVTNQASLTYIDSQGAQQSIDSNIIITNVVSEPTQQVPIWGRTPCGFVINGFDTEYKCYLLLEVKNRSSDDRSITAYWSEAIGPDGPITYEVSYKKVGDADWTTSTQAATSFVLGGAGSSVQLQQTDNYEFKIYAKNNADIKSTTYLQNSVNLAATDTEAPTKPGTDITIPWYSSFRISSVQNNKVALRWEGFKDNTKVTGFLVTYRYPTDASPAQYVTVPVDLASGGSGGYLALAHLDGLKATSGSERYYFAVTAFDEAGNTYTTGNTSATTVPGATIGDYVSPRFPDQDWNQPMIPMTWDPAQSKYKLSWPQAVDNVGIRDYSYMVIDQSKIVNATAAWGTVIDNFVYISSGVEAGKTYTIFVTAYDDANNFRQLGDQIIAPEQTAGPSQPINLGVDDFANTCCGFITGARVRLFWEYDGQSAYQIKITKATDGSVVIDTDEIRGESGKSQAFVNDGSPTRPFLEWNTQYSCQLKVWDSGGKESEWISGLDFTTPKHSYPFVDFDWSPKPPGANKEVKFTNKSNVYGAKDPMWAWEFPNGSPTNSNVQNPSVKFSGSRPKTVELTVTDPDGGFSCTGSKTVDIKLPFPEWREIPPFGSIDKLLAKISDFLYGR